MHLQCTLYLPMYLLFDVSLVVFIVVSMNMSKPGFMYQMLHSFLFNTFVAELRRPEGPPSGAP